MGKALPATLLLVFAVGVLIYLGHTVRDLLIEHRSNQQPWQTFVGPDKTGHIVVSIERRWGRHVFDAVVVSIFDSTATSDEIMDAQIEADQKAALYNDSRKQ